MTERKFPSVTEEQCKQYRNEILKKLEECGVVRDFAGLTEFSKRSFRNAHIENMVRQLTIFYVYNKVNARDFYLWWVANHFSKKTIRDELEAFESMGFVSLSLKPLPTRFGHWDKIWLISRVKKTSEQT
mgnify:CR=1 FL=1